MIFCIARGQTWVGQKIFLESHCAIPHRNSWFIWLRQQGSLRDLEEDWSMVVYVSKKCASIQGRPRLARAERAPGADDPYHIYWQLARVTRARHPRASGGRHLARVNVNIITWLCIKPAYY